MRRYESYKDSDVEWLGEVPSHWEVENSKRVFSYRKDKAEKTDEQLTSSQKYGVIPQNLFMDLEGRRVTVVEFNYEILKHVEKGDFVISMRSFQGGIEYCNYTGCVSSAYVALIPTSKVHSQYYRFLLKSVRYIEALQSTSNLVRDGQALRYENFCMVPLIVPPLSEQQKIAQFLDDKTAKIDQAVDLAEKQIALLKEHKQILIQNAVTRGLNPDVPLKDSGVEWIGQVPEHWEVMRLKFMLSEKLKYGANESAELDDPEQPRYIRITDIDEQGNLKNDTFKSLEFGKAKDYLLKLNDILLARSGATAGKSYIYKENLKNFACYAGYLIRVRLEQKKFNAEFVNYYFQSVGYWDWIKSVNIQATIQNVSAEKYNDFLLSVPNLQEQVTIVDYLDQKTAKIDQAIALKTAHIEKLKEYKSVLINDVVTGKVRVSV